MPFDPSPAPYNSAPQIRSIIEWLGDEAIPAKFPQARLRFRNQRWAQAVGLGDLSEAQWIEHFAKFTPLDANLDAPFALKYHGHQFRVYNSDIGDGRGFLFAQLRDSKERLLDLGTKGSGTTPYSRTADGRLTLKGAVREILATEMLEALGVNTSKTFSVIETGEPLWRDDEPSPARSAVMVRLSHGHIRIGTFQRLFALQESAQMASLIDYCLEHYPGPPPPDDAPAREEPAVILLHQVTQRLADLAASYMVAGFVHGVLNTDNMNISGESFDYGPWRWLPLWEPGFTAAYFDHSGLYAFGRQPEALHWNLAQFARSLSLLADSAPLLAALERFGPLYTEAVARRWCWRLGVKPRGREQDQQLVAACEAHLHAAQLQPDAFFHSQRKKPITDGDLGTILARYERVHPAHTYWQEEPCPSLLIEEVEAIWRAIDEHDDWSILEAKIAAIRRMGEAYGPAPCPCGHTGIGKPANL